MSCANGYTVTNGIMQAATGVPLGSGNGNQHFVSATDAARAKWGDGVEVSFHTLNFHDSRKDYDGGVKYAVVRWPDGTFITTPPKDCEEDSLQEALTTYEPGDFGKAFQGVLGLKPFSIRFSPSHALILNKNLAAEIEAIDLNNPFIDVDEWEEAVIATQENGINQDATIEDASATMLRSRNGIISGMMMMEQFKSDPKNPPYTLAKREVDDCIREYRASAAIRGEAIRTRNVINANEDAPLPWRGGVDVYRDSMSGSSVVTTPKDVGVELAKIRDATDYLKGKRRLSQSVIVTTDDTKEQAKMLNNAQNDFHKLSAGAYQELSSSLDLIRAMPMLDEIQEDYPEEIANVKEALADLLYDPDGPNLEKMPAAIQTLAQWENEIEALYGEQFRDTMADVGLGDLSPSEAIQELFAK